MPKKSTCIHNGCAAKPMKGQRLCETHLKAYILRNTQAMVRYAKEYSPHVEMAEQHRTHVYAVSGAGLVKIGQAWNPQRRHYHLQIGSPVALTLLGYVQASKDLESALHQHLKAHRKHGEWFDLSAAPVTHVVELICAKQEDELYKLANLDTESASFLGIKGVAKRYAKTWQKLRETKPLT